jgi:uracil DNA glycosylase
MATALTVGTAHRSVTTPHPSPLNGTDFVDTVTREKSFTQVNAFLTASGRSPIDWRL